MSGFSFYEGKRPEKIRTIDLWKMVGLGDSHEADRLRME